MKSERIQMQNTIYGLILFTWMSINDKLIDRKQVSGYLEPEVGARTDYKLVGGKF